MLTNKRKFGDIADSFLRNVDSVRVLTQEIAQLADEHDRTKFDELIARVLTIVGTSPDEIERIKNIGRHARQNDTKPGGALAFSTDEFSESLKAAFLKVVKIDPEKIEEIARLSKFAQRIAARQGPLLRQGAITILVSFFESLLADLVQEYYLRFPAALPADANTLTLAELRQLGTIADAEAYVAGKAAGALLRESLEKQLKFFTTRLKIDLAPYCDQIDRLTEVAQRRNLIVHNNSIVNRLYLEGAPASFIASHNIKEGLVLESSAEYLEMAIAGVEAVGFLLIEHAWHKWDKEDAENADKFATNLLFEMLLDGRFQATLDISEMAGGIGIQSDERQRINLINRAIALKHLKRVDEASAILDGVEWSGYSLRFRTVVAAVRHKASEFESLASRALRSGEITKQELLTWPAFIGLRDSDEFARVIAWTAVPIP